MRGSVSLKGTDKDFFRQVSRLTLSNPFEADTLELVYQITGEKFRSGGDIARSHVDLPSGTIR